jgi:hypothetical protein
MGVLGQNAIWMWASWRGIEYIIRGKVVASPKSGMCWVLWVQVCSWLVLAPKVFQLCTNQLVVWFCVSLCEWVNACHVLSPTSELQHAPLPPKYCEPKNMPQLLVFPLFSLQIHAWVYQGAWECITYLWSWAVITFLITSKFLFDSHPFLLEVIGVNSSRPLIF